MRLPHEEEESARMEMTKDLEMKVSVTMRYALQFLN